MANNLVLNGVVSTTGSALPTAKSNVANPPAIPANMALSAPEANTIIGGETDIVAVLTQMFAITGLSLATLRQVSYGTAAPSTGAHNTGDALYLTNPAPGGFVGYVCTAGGTPGTWKAFGLIST
jgi:hypothetical protein